jgi:hypothetical protein
MRFMKFFSRRPRKMPESERLAIELSRVDATEPDWDDLSDEQRRQMAYSKDERKEMYTCRQDLRFVPPVGKNGGIIQAIANELGLSRQYIHQVFYPKNPGKLFSGRAVLQKRAWQMLVRRIQDHPLLPKYKKVFETLLSGQRVEVTISVSKFRWIRKKSLELIPGLVITESGSTVPTTYVLTPPNAR